MMNADNKPLNQQKAGFSLIEVSIVLAILSIVLAGLLPFIVESQKAADMDTTIERMDAIEKALVIFIKEEGRMPCPAAHDTLISSSDFGMEGSAEATLDTDCMNGSIPERDANWQNSNAGAEIAAGAVPTRTLNLPDEYAFDGWGRRFSYIVSEDNVDDVSSTNMTTGVITVGTANDASERTDEAVYALISHGPNGHGGYTSGVGSSNNNRYNAGSTNTDEHENCACNVSADLGDDNISNNEDDDQNAKVIMSNAYGEGVAQFDDIVRYKTAGQLEYELAY